MPSVGGTGRAIPGPGPGDGGTGRTMGDRYPLETVDAMIDREPEYEELIR
jgi:hypothetical protein